MTGPKVSDSSNRAKNWRDDAACREEDPELFFPLGNTGTAITQAEEARAICRRCPAIEACGEWALATGQDAGVWGGMTEDERRTIRRRRSRKAAPRPECGTVEGYQRHSKNGQHIDDLCLAAHTEAQVAKGRAKAAVS